MTACQMETGAIARTLDFEHRCASLRFRVIAAHMPIGVPFAWGCTLPLRSGFFPLGSSFSLRPPPARPWGPAVPAPAILAGPPARPPAAAAFGIFKVKELGWGPGALAGSPSVPPPAAQRAREVA